MHIIDNDRPQVDLEGHKKVSQLVSVALESLEKLFRWVAGDLNELKKHDTVFFALVEIQGLHLVNSYVCCT